MATIAELLASSLNALKQVQRGEDFTIIKSSDLSRTHIKRLVDNHFLKPIIKGWYVVTDPRATPGDSTAWYASFWSFITRYANERYGNEWCLSAEQSLSIYTGATIIPNQVLIRAPKGNDYMVPLIPPTSVFNLGAELPSKIDTNNPYNLNLYTLAEAIIVATPTMYRNDALTMRTALAMVHDSSDILKILVDTGQTVRAGRVIGAFRNIGRTDMADEIAGTMKRMGYIIYEEDPFERVMEIHVSQSPYAVRLRLMWQNMREDVIANFTRLKSNLSAKEFLERMETRYKLDAYHSLSIEGYRVTDELINKVKSGVWKPDGEDMDSKKSKDYDEGQMNKDLTKTFGNYFVRVGYTPENMKLSRYTIDAEQRKGTLFYQYGDEIIRYSMYLNDDDSSFGQKEVDEQSKEFTLDCEKFIANIKEYTITGADQKRYVADFEYMGIHYQLKGCLPKEELEKILKNLIFF